MSSGCSSDHLFDTGRCGEPGLQPLLEKARVEAAGHDIGIEGERCVERQGGRDADDLEAAQRRAKSCKAIGSVRAMHNQFAEQRVVERGHLIAVEQQRVEAYAVAGRCLEFFDDAGPWHEIPIRILRIDAAFDRVTPDRDLVLANRKRQAAGDPQHLLDEVEAGDHLGNGMLDLDPRVDFDEVEGLRRLVIEIFDRSGALIADRAGERDGARAEFFPHAGRKPHRRRFFPDLLAAALQRTFALKTMDEICAVAEDLHLDMPRLLDDFLEIETAIAESSGGFRRRLRKLAIELVEILRDADAASAAACRAATLSPRRRMAAPEGPTKIMPAATTASAKSPFSDRNP